MGSLLSRSIRETSVTLALTAGAVIVIGLDLARRRFRHSLMFCPERQPLTSWSPADHGLPAERVRDFFFPGPGGTTLHGWYCEAEDPITSALYCHGNAGNLTHSAPVIPHLLSAGISVFLFDYRGFGKSAGVPSLSGVIADARAAAREHDRIRPRNVPSIAYGYSLGGAVAARLAGDHSIDGLVLQSTFTSVRDMARLRSRRFPLHFISGNFFDTGRTLRQLDIPVLLIHGTADEVIPSRMTEELVSSCRVSPVIHMIDGGEHRNLYQRDGEAILRRLQSFVSALEMRIVEESPPPGPLEKLRRMVRSISIAGPELPASSVIKG